MPARLTHLGKGFFRYWETGKTKLTMVDATFSGVPLVGMGAANDEFWSAPSDNSHTPVKTRKVNVVGVATETPRRATSPLERTMEAGV